MLVCGDKRYHDYKYDRRQMGLFEQIFKPRDKLTSSKQAPQNLNEPFGIRFKAFLPVTGKNFDRFEKKIANEIQHETDGYIFALNTEPYRPGTCSTLLKWKPPDQNTFDFKARVKQHAGGKVVAHLMVVSDGEEIPFTMSGVSTIETANPAHAKQIRQLEGMVVECKWQPRSPTRRTGCWTIFRVRKDKTHPNSWHTCQKVWQSVLDNIDQARLKSLILLKDHTKQQREQRQPPNSGSRH